MTATHRAPRAWLQRTARGLLWLGNALCALVGMLWGAGALWFHTMPYQGVALAVWCVLWAIAVWRIARSRRPRTLWMSMVVLVVPLLLWWQKLLPQQHRIWADDVAHITRIHTANSGSEVVTLDDVRNFTWRSETDYTPRWEQRSYDLNQLQSVDMAVSYWMGPAIAHTLVSFGFADGEHVVFSFEIRKEKTESFDALAGFFKRYELALIAADERDILAVRTNARGEQVYLYRVDMAPDAMRGLFRAYAEQAAQLHAQPRWYHTLTANCTTVVWDMAQRLVGGLPLDWRLLASGYLPEYLRDINALTPNQSLESLRAAGDITQRAQQWQPTVGADAKAASIDFSRAIRQGIPPLHTP